MDRDVIDQSSKARYRQAVKQAIKPCQAPHAQPNGPPELPKSKKNKKTKKTDLSSHGHHGLGVPWLLRFVFCFFCFFYLFAFGQFLGAHPSSLIRGQLSSSYNEGVLSDCMCVNLKLGWVGGLGTQSVRRKILENTRCRKRQGLTTSCIDNI